MIHPSSCSFWQWDLKTWLIINKASSANHTMGKEKTRVSKKIQELMPAGTYGFWERRASHNVFFGSNTSFTKAISIKCIKNPTVSLMAWTFIHERATVVIHVWICSQICEQHIFSYIFHMDTPYACTCMCVCIVPLCLNANACGFCWRESTGIQKLTITSLTKKCYA